MRLFSRHPSFLHNCATGFLLACFRPAQAASGTVEVDLVFPQNDTYAPTPIIPIAFAFQHSELAGYLQPQISFYITPYGVWNSSAANGYFDMTWVNWTSSDPYIQYGAAVDTLNTEGTWQLSWQLDVNGCSSSGDLNNTLYASRQYMVFTTKKGAKAPDLTAATGGDTCSGAQNLTFDISATRDSEGFWENGKPCAVLGETTPAPTPCAVKIEASAASSLSASLTDRACAFQSAATHEGLFNTQPASWCPESKKDGGARGLVVPSLAACGAAFLGAAIGGLGFFLM